MLHKETVIQNINQNALTIIKRSNITCLFCFLIFAGVAMPDRPLGHTSKFNWCALSSIIPSTLSPERATSHPGDLGEQDKAKLKTIFVYRLFRGRGHVMPNNRHRVIKYI